MCLGQDSVGVGTGVGVRKKVLAPLALLSESGFPWEGDRISIFYFPCIAAR